MPPVGAGVKGGALTEAYHARWGAWPAESCAGLHSFPEVAGRTHRDRRAGALLFFFDPPFSVLAPRVPPPADSRLNLQPFATTGVLPWPAKHKAAPANGE